MVRRQRPRFGGRLRVTFAATGLLLGSCTAGAPVIPTRADPFVYLVLNQREAPGSPQLGLLTTLGSPTSSEYLAATKFRMVRTQDDRVFEFQDRGKRGVARSSIRPLADFGMGNYLLPDESIPDGSGANDIRPGDAFALTVIVGADTIEGGTHVPAAFVARIENIDGAAVVVWPKVQGAVAYGLTFRNIHLTPRIQTDTTFTLPEMPLSGSEISVKAMDENLARYSLDSTATAVGISRGFGVFGAISAAPTIIVTSESSRSAVRRQQ